MTRDIGKPGDSKDKGRRYRDTDNPRDIAGLPHALSEKYDNMHENWKKWVAGGRRS